MYAFVHHWFVPNGLSLKRDIETSRTREECREEIGILPGEKLCIILGWDLHRKGLDIACKAVQECRRKDPSIVLGVVGLGSKPKEHVVQYLREHGIDANASWIHYLPDTEDIYACHRSADIYLSTSRMEGFPYGVLETLSQNTTVVMSDIESTVWAKEFECVYPYPVEDVSACAQAIMMGLNGKKSQANADRVMKLYGIEKWCKEIAEIYDAL